MRKFLLGMMLCLVSGQVLAKEKVVLPPTKQALLTEFVSQKSLPAKKKKFSVDKPVVPRAVVFSCQDLSWEALKKSRDTWGFVSSKGPSFEASKKDFEALKKKNNIPPSVIFVVGHTRCETVETVFNKLTGHFSKWPDPKLVSLKFPKPKIFPLMTDEWNYWVEYNVNQQVKKMMGFYADEIASGETSVIGLVKDGFDDYEKGRNKLNVINVNGETRKNKLRDLPLLKNLAL